MALKKPELVKLVVEALVRVELPVTANVPVAVRLDPVKFPLKYPLPATSSLLDGVVVPMPTLPDTIRPLEGAALTPP